MKYKITAAYLHETYDNDGFETREEKVSFPEIATLEELIEEARTTCEMQQFSNDFFFKMEMKKEPSVFSDIQDGEGYIDISFYFTEGDFTTDMQVSYTVNVVAE